MATPVIFHFRSRSSFLNKANPLSKLLFLIALCFPLMHASFSFSLGLLSLLLVTAILLHLPFGQYVRDFTFFLIMGVLIALTEYHAKGSLQATFAAIFRFLDFIIMSILFSDTTDMDDLARCLGPLLDKIPFLNGYRIAASIQLTLSLIPLIFDVTSCVLDAQNARFANKRRPLTYLKNAGVGIFSKLLDKCEDFSDSLEARLFDGDHKKKGLGFSWRDPILVMVASLSVAGGYLW
ncbi:MAG: energy-coupling factor transporter transmembrane component T [Sphaerochaetaceae bacterium]